MEIRECFVAELVFCSGICPKHGVVVSFFPKYLPSFPCCRLCGSLIKVDIFSDDPEENPQTSDFVDFMNEADVQGALVIGPAILASELGFFEEDQGNNQTDKGQEDRQRVWWEEEDYFD